MALHQPFIITCAPRVLWSLGRLLLADLGWLAWASESPAAPAGVTLRPRAGLGLGRSSSTPRIPLSLGLLEPTGQPHRFFLLALPFFIVLHELFFRLVCFFYYSQKYKGANPIL